MLPQNYTIQAREGKLYIVEKSPNFYIPQWDILWWPTGIPAAFRRDAVGMTVRPGYTSGTYRSDDGVTWPLIDGGQTRPTFVEHEPIPRPKTRVETKYYSAAWHKKLKSGWVEYDI